MIYLILAKDKLLVDQQVDKIEEFTKKHVESIERVVFNGGTQYFSFNELIEECLTPSFLSASKLIVVYNFPGLSAKSSIPEEVANTFLDLIEHESDINLILHTEGIDRKRKLTKSLQKNAKLIDCISNINHTELFNQLLKKYQLNMDTETKKYLFNALKSSPDLMDAEINKLSLYNDTITKRDIDALASLPIEDQIWTFCDALMYKKKQLMLSTFKDLMLLRYEPIVIINIMAQSFRRIFQYSVLAQANKSRQSIEQTMGISPYQANAIHQKSKNADPYHILAILNDLADLDQSLKLGAVDKRLGLEIFMLKAVQ